jgi:aldehyde dehydrogenase (NAD+)
VTPEIESTPTPATDLAGIPETVARLRNSFESGRTRPLEWRQQQLRRLHAMMSENGDDLVAALQADLRKPELEAWAADVSTVTAEAKLALKNLKRWTRPEKVRTPLYLQPSRTRIVREPLGVVLIISPWNYPLQLLLGPLVGALAAGNCAVLKPSEITAHTSGVLARLVPRYLDPEAVALVEGAVPETTALLGERFDHIFYTGNGRVARVVMEAAARNLTPVTLELGGKSPCIVDDDVDLDVAARRIAWGKFLNAGQTCIAPDYVLVKAEREQELLDALSRCLVEFYGDDPRRSADLARIASDNHYRRLAGLIKDGDIVVGGECDASERYIAPTILRNVDPSSDAMQEEIFGPILPVLTVPDIASAIEFVNARPKPLALYVFTNRQEVEDHVISQTSSGGACVNATLWHIANPAVPFGGVGPSGMGAYHGRATFETFSHHKGVVTRSARFDPKIAYPPYTRLKTSLLKRFA